MKSVFLHGKLGDHFGKKWRLSVESPQEAIKALIANAPEIHTYLTKKQQEGVVYGIKKNKNSGFLNEGEWGMKAPGSLHIFPIPQGSGTFTLNLLLAVATTAASMYISKKMAEAMERDDSTVSSETKSYLFNGGANRYNQGATVPLGYGRMKVGSNVISSCVVNYDYDSDKGQIFNFNSGLYSLVPSYSKYYNRLAGGLGSSFLLNLFDGTSEFSAVDPAFQFLKNTSPSTYFGSNDGVYGKGYDEQASRDMASNFGTQKEGNLVGGYFYYTMNFGGGVDISMLENWREEGFRQRFGNWYPESKTGDVTDGWYPYRVTGPSALKSSYVAMQSIPKIDTNDDDPNFFYPITFSDELLPYLEAPDTLQKKDAAGVFPVQVGQRWRDGNKKNGAAWFKLESASVYKAVDLICEGPIDGLSNVNGDSLKFTRRRPGEEMPQPGDAGFIRNPKDDYLQGVYLDETQVKEVTMGGMSAGSKDAYNINELDIDIGTNTMGSIGVEDQKILEPQYLFTANTVEINSPLFGPRAIDLGTIVSDPESVQEFQENVAYAQDTLVRVNDGGNAFLFKIGQSLNTPFVANGDYATPDNSTKIEIVNTAGGGGVDFYSATENINNYRLFSGEYVNYAEGTFYEEGDKIRATSIEGGIKYYKMGADAKKFLGIFDANQEYTAAEDGKLLMDKTPNPIHSSVPVAKITGTYAPGDTVTEPSSPTTPPTTRPKTFFDFTELISANFGDPPKSVTTDPIYTLKQHAEFANVVGAEIDITPKGSTDANEKLWQNIVIKGPNNIKNGPGGPGEDGGDRSELGIFRPMGEVNEAAARTAAEEFYISHTVINPLVEELYVTLQVDELGYLYEGDKVEVEYSIGALWGALLGALIAAEGWDVLSDQFQKDGVPGVCDGGCTTKWASLVAKYGHLVVAGILGALLGAFLGETLRFSVGTKIENSGELWPNRARFRIKYGNEAEIPYTTDIYINGVATSPYRKDIKIYLPPNPSRKDRTVKIFKLNRERNPVKEGEASARYKERLSVAGVTEITPCTLSYPNSVVIGTRINARDISSIPTRSYNLKMKRVAVPTNYNSKTREYTGPWAGLFKGQAADDKNAVVPEGAREWTDNPAWCLYDLISDKRYGVGRFGLKAENVDRWTLYRVAKYCDEMVPTGYSSKFLRRKFEIVSGSTIRIEGLDAPTYTKEFSYPGRMLAIYHEDKSYESIKIEGVNSSAQTIELAYEPKGSQATCSVAVDYPLVEPRYTLNAFLMNSKNAFKLINEIAAIFRTYAYWAGGAINFFQDEKKDSVMLFANNNISKEGFSYSSTPKTSRTNSCKIRYVDRFNKFKPKMEYSEDMSAIQENNLIEQTIDGFGITSQAQAKRASEFVVQSANLETEIVSFETSALGSYLRPGDIVDVLDNKRTVGRFAGKVLNIEVSGDGKAAEIDVDFPIRTIIDEDDKSTWKKITLYTISGNQTLGSLDSGGAVSDQEIKDLRASQIGEYIVGKISRNDTRLRIINNPYSFITGEYTWSQALVDARDRGGMLGTINNEIDQSQVQSILPKESSFGAGDSLAWIAAYNQEMPPPEKFVWYQPQDCDGDGVTYFSWADGFPKVGDPLETDALDGADNIQTDDLDNSLNISADPLTDEFGNYVAVSGSTNTEIHGDWVTISGSTGIGYILERRADNSLLQLNGIAGTTFSIEDSVNLASKHSYKVINVSEKSHGIFAIQGLQYNSGKFGRIEENLSLVSPASPVIFTEKSVEPPPLVSLGILDETLSQGIPYGIQASWDHVEGAVSYRVQFFEGNILLSTFEVPRDISTTSQTQVYRSAMLTENGTYTARVTSIGAA
jgi:predicted phage tail protein